MKKAKNRKRVSPILIVLFVFAVLSLAGYFTYKYLLETYRVVNVYVEGNVHYTDDEIKELIMTGDYGDNSLYLSHKYKNKEVTDIPFVETINVKILSKDSVKITVYEKALAGYVEYLGKYIYFDKDGIWWRLRKREPTEYPRLWELILIMWYFTRSFRPRTRTFS